MTVQAPTLGDVRATRFDAKVQALAWLRGIGVRQVRLACGLIMFAYIFSHFFNHALGNISYPLMQDWLWYHIWWWRIPVVNITLYSAAMIHFSLGLWALYQRRHFRYTAAEITQLVLGLSIPLWLASHFGAQRVSGWLYDWPPSSYASPAVRLLGAAAAHDRRPDDPDDGRVDACLHRSLFLATHEAVLPLGGPDPLVDRRAAAAAGDARRAPGRAGSDPARQGPGLACAEHQADPARQARGHRQHHALLFPHRLRGGDPAGVRGTRGALAATSAGAERLRCRIRAARCAFRKG